MASEEMRVYRDTQADDNIHSYWLKQAQPIGKGFYGSVYLAISGADGSQIAVKRLRLGVGIMRDEGYVATETARQRFENRLHKEYNIWKDLHHPNIAPLIGYWLSHEISELLLVTPYYKNGTVRKFTKGKDLKYKLKILQQVTQGLQYLHKRKIVHHDLKGSNVVVDDDDNARLIDFGVSVDLNAMRKCTSSNVSGDVRWLPPEIVIRNLKSQPYNPRLSVDIWSFGCLLLEVLSESDPWVRYPTSLITNELKVKMLSKHREIPGEKGEYKVDHQVSEFMWKICYKCWNYDESKRPSIGYLCSKFTTAAASPQSNTSDTPIIQLLINALK
ncbi:hypothetical protein FRC02_008056 [Tulasnella sp. 418]|nr:hypothetical protein FRC02_008056 [Tulasnella sp. 418]